jgi:hypothetical protein
LVKYANDDHSFREKFILVIWIGDEVKVMRRAKVSRKRTTGCVYKRLTCFRSLCTLPMSRRSFERSPSMCLPPRPQISKKWVTTVSFEYEDLAHSFASQTDIVQKLRRAGVSPRLLMCNEIVD